MRAAQTVPPLHGPDRFVLRGSISVLSGDDPQSVPAEVAADTIAVLDHLPDRPLYRRSITQMPERTLRPRGLTTRLAQLAMPRRDGGPDRGPG